MKITTLLIITLTFTTFLNAQTVATYNVTFTNYWNATDHSIGTTFPSDAHWSELVGVNHNSNVTFVEVGTLASTGVENIAEIGNKVHFRDNDVQNAIDANHAEQFIDGEGLDLINGNTIEILGLQVSENYPLLTLLSMIAPSPDWMIYVNGLNLRNAGNTEWLNSITIDLYPYDAGTEDGNDYNLNNSTANPHENIASLQGTAPFNNERVAQIAVELQNVLNTNDNSLNVIKLFPNPSKGTITFDNINDIENIEIYNVLGKQVTKKQIKLDTQHLTLNLEALNKGMYLIKFVDLQGNKSITQKLVLQ